MGYCLQGHLDCLAGSLVVALLEEHMRQGVPVVAVGGVELDLSFGVFTALVSRSSADFS